MNISQVKSFTFILVRCSLIANESAEQCKIILLLVCFLLHKKQIKICLDGWWPLS